MGEGVNYIMKAKDMPVSDLIYGIQVLSAWLVCRFRIIDTVSAKWFKCTCISGGMEFTGLLITVFVIYVPIQPYSR